MLISFFAQTKYHFTIEEIQKCIYKSTFHLKYEYNLLFLIDLGVNNVNQWEKLFFIS